MEGTVSRKSLDIFNRMLPDMRDSIAGSVGDLCLEAIARNLMTFPEQAGILEGGNKYKQTSLFLEHFALKIKVTPEVLFEFTDMLTKLRTCDGIVQKLTEHTRGKKRPNYKSPLDEEASSGTNPLPVGPPGSGASVGVPQQFNSSMTVDELHSWLLSKNVPPQDCKLIKDQSINGTSFKLVSEDQWKTFGLTLGGLLILQQILKQVPSSGHENGSARNGSTSSNGSTNDSSHGCGSNGNARRTAPSGGSGRTLIKDHHYGSLCEQLRPCAASWEDIAKYLEFKGHEIANLRADPMKLMSAPGSYMDSMIDKWSHWAPSDARKSKDYATLEALRNAVDKAGYHVIALELTLK